VNPTANGKTPEVTFALKLATGAGTVTLMNVTDEVPVPATFVAFRIIDQLPAPNVYVTLFAVENWTLVLFPVVFWRLHDQEVGTLLEVSLNLTATGAIPEVAFAVNEATGVRICVTFTDDRLVLVPQPLSDVVKLTVKLPPTV
jgi:hypothetical protein